MPVYIPWHAGVRFFVPVQQRIRVRFEVGIRGNRGHSPRLHCVPKNDTALTCYNLFTNQPVSTILADNSNGTVDSSRCCHGLCFVHHITLLHQSRACSSRITHLNTATLARQSSCCSRKTPEFISPDLWPSNSPRLNPVDLGTDAGACVQDTSS